MSGNPGTGTGVRVIEDLSAGSEATTLLCVDSSRTFYRKCAFGPAAEKLGQQIEWIREHAGLLPLPGILRHRSGGGACFYDMPYSPSTLDLFNLIHSTPVERSWAILEAAFSALEGRLYLRNRRPLDRRRLDDYIRVKAHGNLKKIMGNRAVAGLQQYPELFINGRAYRNLPALRHLLAPEHLRGIFAGDACCDIHGDLTVENIIGRVEAADPAEGFYLIDPNTGNIHESPNLDYAKMLQSLHGSYEFYARAANLTAHDDRLDFSGTGSAAYSSLYGRYRDWLFSRFGPERTRSIYFHELVHWLRLLPLKKDAERSLIFYAGFIIVLNDTAAMFGYLNEEK